MAGNALSEYLESKILSADPVELVQILYRAASEAVENARRYLKQRDILARVKEINKAISILGELGGSLNHEVGGEFSRTMHALYDYMMRRLVEANQQQSDSPLAEVSTLLATVSDGWMNCKPVTWTPVAQVSPAFPAASEPPEDVAQENREYSAYVPAASAAPAYTPYTPAVPAYTPYAPPAPAVPAYTPFAPPAPAPAAPAFAPFVPPTPAAPDYAPYREAYTPGAYASSEYGSDYEEAAESGTQESRFALSY